MKKLTRAEKRGLLERKRRKKFLYLKHTGRLEEYYRQKFANRYPKKEIKLKPKPIEKKFSFWAWIKNVVDKLLKKR